MAIRKMIKASRGAEIHESQATQHRSVFAKT